MRWRVHLTFDHVSLLEWKDLQAQLLRFLVMCFELSSQRGFFLEMCQDLVHHYSERFAVDEVFSVYTLILLWHLLELLMRRGPRH